MDLYFFLSIWDKLFILKNRQYRGNLCGFSNYLKEFLFLLDWLQLGSQSAGSLPVGSLFSPTFFCSKIYRSSLKNEKRIKNILVTKGYWSLIVKSDR